jgi:hypothetical protein
VERDWLSDYEFVNETSGNPLPLGMGRDKRQAEYRLDVVPTRKVLIFTDSFA